MEIRLLPNLDLSPSGLISFHDRRLSEENRLVTLRQGDLDGACGPYALMMALIAHGAITRKDAVSLWQGKLDGRVKLGRVLSNLETLLRDGTESSQLVALFDALQRYSKLEGLACNANLQRLRITPTEERGQALFKSVRTSIDQGFPMILGLEWTRNAGHWVVAIGYQAHKKNHDDPSCTSKLESILVLDPSSGFNTTSAWNGVLTVMAERGSLPFTYWTNDQAAVACDAQGGLLFQPY